MLVFLKFIIACAAIIYAGYKLSLYGDIISEKTSITRSLMGFVFLALATSLPEFAVSGSSILAVNSPDLAVGDIFGSIVINIGILTFLSVFSGSILIKASKNHILPTAFTILLISTIGFFLFIRKITCLRLAGFNIGFESLVIVVIFILGIRLVFRHEKVSVEEIKTKKYSNISLRFASILFCLYFIVVVFLGIWLSRIGREITVLMGWTDSLVGTFFLGLATSFPELVVTITAIKFSVDMAVGDIIGSNFIDCLIIPFCDILHRKGPILSDVSASHISTLFLAMILSSILIIGFFYKSKRKFLKMGWTEIALIITFVSGICFLVKVL